MSRLTILFVCYRYYILTGDDSSVDNTYRHLSRLAATVERNQSASGKLEEEEVRVLEKGDYFGEQALLKEECRSANVIALPPGVECLTLGRE